MRFAQGDDRINVHISLAQERIDEIQTLVSRGNLSEDHINSFTNELEDIRELVEEEPFDTLQQARVRGISESAAAVLSEVEEEHAPAAAEAIDQAQQVAAAASGESGAGVTPLDKPHPRADAPADSGAHTGAHP